MVKENEELGSRFSTGWIKLRRKNGKESQNR